MMVYRHCPSPFNSYLRCKSAVSYQGSGSVLVCFCCSIIFSVSVSVPFPFRLFEQPGAPAELVLLNPDSFVDVSYLGVTEAGTRLPPLSLGALDAAGNRTAPAPTETWTVS